MNIVVVTSKAPFGNGEPYLLPEMRELVRHFDRITLVPVHPPRANAQPLPPGIDVLPWPLASFALLRLAARAVIFKPARTAAVCLKVLQSKAPGKTRNALVMLKGLALGQWAIDQSVDHVHAYWLSTPATVAMIAAGIAGIPWSSTAHRLDIYKRNALDAKVQSVSFVRTISHRGTDDLIARESGLAERVVYMPLGTRIPFDAPPAERLRMRDSFRIVCAAGLAPRKGQMELLEALATLRKRNVPVRCTFAGDGAFRGALDRRVKELKLEPVVTFAGFVPQNRLLEQYRSNAFDVLAMCSQADTKDNVPAEGLPAAMIEAMAHCVPVVATDSGGIGELVDDGCGWLIPASNAAALADALYEVYAEPGVARARALAAFRRVSSVHDARNQMHKLTQYIAGAAGAHA